MCNVGIGHDMDGSDDFGDADFGNAMFTLPSVEVSTAAPHRISFASNEWLDLFQFSREEMAGRSLRIVFGPCTIMKELQRVIDTARDGKEAQGTIIAYSSSGQGKVVVVKSSPLGSDGASCKLTMLLSDAISFKDASMVEDAPRAIISLGQRPVVEYVNARFAFDFGVPGTMAAKALRMIQGPRTDTSSFMQAMCETKTGFVQSVQTYVYSSECKETLCEVRFQPLLGNDGVISHLLAVFMAVEEFEQCYSNFELQAPATNVAPVAPTLDCTAGHQYPAHLYSTEPAVVSSGDWDCRDSYVLPVIPEGSSDDSASPTGATTFDFGAFEDALAPMEATSNSAIETATPSPVSEESSGTRTSLKLVPRKKRDFSGKSSGAFELTTEKLREMGRISMKQAAHELGIAPSTLKKACRKLGVERWPHGSHGGSKSKGSMDYDGSYVRRLFAKYSRKQDGDMMRAGTPDASASGSDVEEERYFAQAPAVEQAPAQQQEQYMQKWQPAAAALDYEAFAEEKAVLGYGFECHEPAVNSFAPYQPVAYAGF
mmetsp:Transcript_38767/g.91543  ORF Transcript_38767/g.91543 Transcript_38767/m.91543 type:complete len:542 (-) Transcript_38767:62-1687(-)